MKIKINSGAGYPGMNMNTVKLTVTVTVGTCHVHHVMLSCIIIMHTGIQYTYMT